MRGPYCPNPKVPHMHFCVTMHPTAHPTISLEFPMETLFKRVIVTPAVYPSLVEFLHFDIQSTGQKSGRVLILADCPSLCFN